MFFWKHFVPSRWRLRFASQTSRKWIIFDAYYHWWREMGCRYNIKCKKSTKEEPVQNTSKCEERCGNDTIHSTNLLLQGKDDQSYSPDLASSDLFRSLDIFLNDKCVYSNKQVKYHLKQFFCHKRKNHILWAWKHVTVRKMAKCSGPEWKIYNSRIHLFAITKLYIFFTLNYEIRGEMVLHFVQNKNNVNNFKNDFLWNKKYFCVRQPISKKWKNR